MSIQADPTESKVLDTPGVNRPGVLIHLRDNGVDAGVGRFHRNNVRAGDKLFACHAY